MKKHLYDHFYKLETHHWWFQARKDIILRMLSLYRTPSEKKKTLLDIGCGTGMMLQAFGRLGRVTGIDMDKKAVKYSGKRAPEAVVIQGSFPEQMPKRTFDIITALDVLEHIEDDESALKKLATHLKPNGVLLLTVPAYSFLWTSHDDANEHKRRYTAPEIREKAAAAGLRIRKVSYYNTFLFLPIAAVKIASKLLRSTRSPFDLTPPQAVINTPLQFIFSLERYILPYISFPFGISIILIAQKAKKYA